jgi:alpha-N-arabinofuranosidase
MDTLIQQHSAIMDRHDPDRRVALVVDEYGTWYDVLPGTEPGFLHQQSSLRDALAAALNLHIFQAHAERVRMANIAQMVNVLQAVVLTDGARMLLTPTYHVFEMLKVHQGATRLAVELETPAYAHEGESMPLLSASASRDAEGRLHLSLTNADPNRAARLKCRLSGASVSSVTGRVLTADAVNSINTFDAPDTVAPRTLEGAGSSQSELEVEIPAKCVAALHMR